MSVVFSKEDDRVLSVTVEGVLSHPDMKTLETKISEAIDRKNKSNLLLVAKKFEGWGKNGDWGSLEFMFEHDPYIDKIAVVTSEKWKDQISMFINADLRKAKVEFFQIDEEQNARSWLAE